MQMSSEENTFRSGLRLELPYLVDALGKDHGFLHDARQFEFLAEIVADHHRHGSSPLSSFLVAGCDRGLDAYSLCITLLEEAKEHSGLEFSILATDFLPANLDQAKRGVYPSASVRSVPRAGQALFPAQSRFRQGSGQAAPRSARDGQFQMPGHFRILFPARTDGCHRLPSGAASFSSCPGAGPGRTVAAISEPGRHPGSGGAHAAHARFSSSGSCALSSSLGTVL